MGGHTHAHEDALVMQLANCELVQRKHFTAHSGAFFQENERQQRALGTTSRAVLDCSCRQRHTEGGCTRARHRWGTLTRRAAVPCTRRLSRALFMVAASQRGVAMC